MVDSCFGWGKAHVTSNACMLRFQTQKQLHHLHQILGIGATYRTIECCPTLKHGAMGMSLKPGHTLTVVKGLVNCKTT